MAFRCNDCRYIYVKKRINCPFCGGRIYDDLTSNESLLKDGFTWAPGQSQSSDASTVSMQDKHPRNTDPADPFESLRQDFFSEHEQPNTQENSSTVNSSPIEKTTIHSTPRQPAVDFFSNLETSSSPNNIPTVNPEDPTLATSTPNRSPDPYERELQELERQRQREEKRYRRRETINSLTTIPWGTIARLFLVIVFVLVAIIIWNMRYAIINSILDFIIALVPIIIVIWFIFQLLRSLFK